MMLYPVMLNIKGKKCVIIGGGSVASRKIRGLLTCCEKITIVSPTLCDELNELRHENEIQWIKDCYDKKYIEDAFLCFACTDCPETNAKILEHCNSMGVLINIIDGTADGDFVVPAVRREENITIAAACGDNPAASRYLADYMQACIMPWMKEYIGITGRVRSTCKEFIKDTELRQDYMKKLFSKDLLELAKKDIKIAHRVAEELLDRLIEKAGEGN